MVEFRYRALLKMNQVIHAGAFCILPGCLYDVPVNIIALYVDLHIRVDHLLGFLYALVPQLAVNQVRPLLRRELTVHSGRNTGSNHRRLYRERTAAAERIHQNPIRSPRCQQQQGSCQRLGQRCLARQGAVSALMQGVPGRIQRHHNLVLQQKDAHRIRRPVLREPFHIVVLLHALHHRLLRDRLNIRRRKQLALDGRCLFYPELSVHRDIVLPRKRLDSLK